MMELKKIIKKNQAKKIIEKEKLRERGLVYPYPTLPYSKSILEYL